LNEIATVRNQVLLSFCRLRKLQRLQAKSRKKALVNAVLDHVTAWERAKPEPNAE
jgi:hypothetical protein